VQFTSKSQNAESEFSRILLSKLISCFSSFGYC
jgi:hypothetical protein